MNPDVSGAVREVFKAKSYMNVQIFVKGSYDSSVRRETINRKAVWTQITQDAVPII